jgi:PKD repeat protein
MRTVWSSARTGFAIVLALGATVLCSAEDKTGASVQFTGSYGRIEKSRTSGVAPLLVHLSADFTGDPDQGQGFRYYEYSWNFGDPGSGRWGTTGLDRNVAKGAVTAHVFEKPGNYTVTLQVRGHGGAVALESFIIQVEDPDLFHEGARTVCVSDLANPDFTGAPEGALCIATDNLGDITRYALPGRRILLRRGSAWSVRDLFWPENAGTVTIGAFGPVTGVDELGLAHNAPRITVKGGVFLVLDGKQDWRIMDLHLLDPSKRYGSFGGTMEMQRLLFLRLRIDGFSTTFGWSHWNTSRLMPLDQMAVVSCDMSGGNDNIAYVGSQRLALLGNRFRDAGESHVVRVWQAYKSVISDNQISGASLDSLDGRHALKLHGPGYSTFQGVNEYGIPVPETGLLQQKTEFVVVSDNVFGSSGPWPVTIGPQDSLTDSSIENLVFERNRIISQYGSQGRRKVDVALNLWASRSVVRNNIFDGTGSGNDYTAIVVDRRGVEPAPRMIEVYNNTIYRTDNAEGNRRTGITVGASASGVIIKNNVIVFPKSSVSVLPIQDSGKGTVKAANPVISASSFIDAGNQDPLSRNFRLKPGASVTGEPVPVFDDAAGAARPAGLCAVGAF